MDKGLVPPCLELGDGPEHVLLAWMSKKAGSRGLVKLDPAGLIEQGAKRAFQDHHATRRTEAAMRHLLDGDYIERTDIGFEISDPGSCWKGGNPQNPLAARRPVGIVMRGAHGDAEAQLSGLVSPVSSLGVKSESVQNPVSLLARDFFPTVFSGDMRPQLNWQALARGLKIWRSDHSISLNTMRLMMVEFGRHPEWWRRSDKPVWVVFLGRRDKLAALVESRRKRHPGDRRYSAGQGRDYWLGRHTPRSYSPA